MKHRTLTTAVIVPMLLCQCNSSKPIEQIDDTVDDPMPAVEPTRPTHNEVTAPTQETETEPAVPEEAVQLVMTDEEAEDLYKVITPLCAAQGEIDVYYHGIQYKGEKPKAYLLGKLTALDFLPLATATHSVANGEVADDFERYTFRPVNGTPVEAYISRSNREYGIELTEAPAVYAPAFHDRILAMRNTFVIPPDPSVAQQAQH